jgi:hypothetical protein
VSIWGDLPEQRFLAVIVDQGHENGPHFEIVGFKYEKDAYSFCISYDSICYEWAVISGCVVVSGSVSDGRS